MLVVEPLEEDRVLELSGSKAVWSVTLSLGNEVIDFFAPDPELILVTDTPSLVADSNDVLEVAAFGKRKFVPFATLSSFGVLFANSECANRTVFFLPVDVNETPFVARESLDCFGPLISWSIHGEWPVLIVLGVMTDLTIK